MPSPVLHEQAKKFVRKVPDIVPGYTIRVHEKVQEGGKERIQIFEGIVISVHRGHVPSDASFTVRKIVSGIGVEKVFPLHSSMIDKIEVKKEAKARRAKLFFLRGRSGKAARLHERFMTGEEQAAFQNQNAPKVEAPAAAKAEESEEKAPEEQKAA